MVLRSTQPLTEINTRNLLWGGGGKGRPALKAENLTAIYESIVYKVWDPRRLTTLWTSMACYRDSFTLPFTLYLTLCFSCVNISNSVNFCVQKKRLTSMDT
jgi:hypothetical protein